MQDSFQSGAGGLGPEEGVNLLRPPADRRARTIELLVFLFLILPSTIISFLVVKPGQVGFTVTAFATIFRDLSLVSLIFFFAWRDREPLTHLGWTRARWPLEAALGIVLFVPFTFSTGYVEGALRQAGVSAPSTPLPSFLTASDVPQFVLAGFLVAVVAISEEVIFRGYLIVRLGMVLGSSAAGLFLAAGIFSLGHGYEGAAGVITVAYMGIILGLVFLWRRSLIAPMVMHFLQDFIGILVLPLIGHH